MRRVLTAAALGLLWANAAPAQEPQEPQAFGKDYVADDPPLMCDTRDFITRASLDADGPPELRERRAKWLRSVAPGLFGGPGKNVDASCYDDVVRTKGELTWDMLRPFDCRARYTPPRIEPDYRWLEVLYYLCFFDALSTIKLGPDMDPHFNESREPCLVGDWF